MLNILNYQLRSYGVSALVIILALILKLLLEQWIEVENLFLLFLPAVMFSTWYGGLGPGLLATIVSGLLSYYYLVDPEYSLLVKFLGQTIASEQEIAQISPGMLSPKQNLELGLFLLESTLFSSVTGKLRASLPKVEKLVRDTGAYFHSQPSDSLKTQLPPAQVVDILDSITDGLIIFDREWRITFVNQQAVQIAAKPKEALIGKRISEIYSETISLRFSKDFTRAIATLKPICLQRFFPPLNKWFEIHAYPSPQGLAVYFRDITERKQTEEKLENIYSQNITEQKSKLIAEHETSTTTELLRRSTFLAQATKVLASAFDYEATLSTVVSLAVPFLADYCLIFKLQPDGKLQLFRATHHDLQQQPLLDELVNLYQTSIQHPSSFTAQVLRTGKPILVSETTYEMATSLTESNRMLEIYCELNPKSFMVVPLTARGQVFGTIMFVASASGRRYNNSDLEIAEDLAYCAALAIDNARLYRDTQQALKHQAELLSLIDGLLSAAPLAVCFLDRELRYVRINQVLAAMNGFTVEQHLGRKFRDLLPEMAAQFEPQLQQVLDTGEPLLNVEISGETWGKPGKYGLWLGNYYPVRNAEGETVGIGIILTEITEIKQAQAQAKAADNKIVSILESISDAFFAVDGEWRFTYINSRCAEIMQRSKVELLGKNIWSEFPAFINTDFYKQYHQALAQQTVVHFEAPGPESKRWFEAHAYPVADGLAVYLREITARKQAEKALRESEELFRAMFNQAAVGITLVRIDGQFIEINPAMCDITGYSHEELLQITFKEITHPDDLDSDLAYIEKVLAREINGYSIEKRFIRKDGSCVWVNLTSSAVWDLSGELRYAVGIIEDISDRKRAEMAQQFLVEASTVLASSLDYETTLTNIAHLSVPTLADWCIVDFIQDDSINQLALACANPAKEQILYELRRRYPPAANKQHPLLQIIRKGEPVFYPKFPDAGLVAAAQNNEHLQMLRSLGMKSVMIIPLKSRGQVFGCLSFVSADSGRRYSQADVALAEDIARRAATAIDNARLYSEAQNANRLKDEFLAILSHELRTPLNSILGWAQILRSRKPDQTKTVRALETIERNAKIQKQLIEDLLDVSRIIQGKLVLNIAPIDLADVIVAAINTMRPAADAKRIQVEFVNSADLGLISGDANRLQQVAWNLISNAIKFTPEGGRVEVKLSVLSDSEETEEDKGDKETTEREIQSKIPNPKSQIPYHSTIPNYYAQIQVTDTGKGISSDFLPYVFERFRQADSSFTRIYGGLGLGLAIVRHLVELHGGTVKAESAGDGQGATFTVKLPLVIPIQNSKFKIQS